MTTVIYSFSLIPGVAIQVTAPKDPLSATPKKRAIGRTADTQRVLLRACAPTRSPNPKPFMHSPPVSYVLPACLMYSPQVFFFFMLSPGIPLCTHYYCSHAFCNPQMHSPACAFCFIHVIHSPHAVMHSPLVFACLLRSPFALPTCLMHFMPPCTPRKCFVHALPITPRICPFALPACLMHFTQCFMQRKDAYLMAAR